MKEFIDPFADEKEQEKKSIFNNASFTYWFRNK